MRCYAGDVDRKDSISLQTVSAVAEGRANKTAQPLILCRELDVALGRLVAVMFPAKIAGATERAVQGVALRHEVLASNLMEFDLQSAPSKLLSHRHEFRSHLAKTVYRVAGGFGADVPVHSITGERPQQATAEPSRHVPASAALVRQKSVKDASGCGRAEIRNRLRAGVTPQYFSHPAIGESVAELRPALNRPEEEQVVAEQLNGSLPVPAPYSPREGMIVPS